MVESIVQLLVSLGVVIDGLGIALSDVDVPAYELHVGKNLVL